MTKSTTIDVNSDLGEGIGNEAELMPFITSCNIACGGHAGSLATVAQVIALAKENRVRVGAHPSFPDKKNFGRQFLPMPITLLRESLLEQIKMVASECERQGIVMNHIKPHGALYHKCTVDRRYAEMMISLTQEFFPQALLYVPYRSSIAKMAEGRVKTAYEVFADRNYNDDLTLVSRNAENALITDENMLIDHILSMTKKGKVKTVTGNKIPVRADTLCVHGDTPGALALVKKINAVLTQNNLLTLEKP